MKTLCFSLIFVLFSISCFAGTRDPAVPDSKYLEYGQKHECVLPIMGVLSDDLNSHYKGSCILIDEYHILTAAHVIYGSLTQDVIFNGQAYGCSIVGFHIDYDHKKMGFNDIAIGRLSRPIKLDFYPELYEGKDEVDKICSLAGYGFTGTFKTGYIQSNYDNKKRAGSNIIDGVEDNVLTYSVGKGTNTELEFLICPGDSGGGLFIDQKLAGIHSCVYARDGRANSDYGDVGCSTRISDHIGWIKKMKNLMKTIVEKTDAIQEKK